MQRKSIFSTKPAFTLMFLLLSGLFLGGCTTTIPFNTTYQGTIAPNRAVPDGYVDVQTTILDKEGKQSYDNYANSVNSALKDALSKHHIPVEAAPGLGKYDLKTTVAVLPDMSLWKKKPSLGKNLGMAIIPFAGVFTPRFYEVSTGFNITFALSSSGKMIDEQTFTMKEEKEVKVSNSKRDEESTEAALRLWEKNRDMAIEKFFKDLQTKYPQLKASN